MSESTLSLTEQLNRKLHAIKERAASTLPQDSPREVEASSSPVEEHPDTVRANALQAELDHLRSSDKIETQFARAETVAAFRSIVKELEASGYEFPGDILSARDVLAKLPVDEAIRTAQSMLALLLEYWRGDTEEFERSLADMQKTYETFHEGLKRLNAHAELIRTLPAQHYAYYEWARAGCNAAIQQTTRIEAANRTARNSLALASEALKSEAPSAELLKLAFRSARQACVVINDILFELWDDHYRVDCNVSMALSYLDDLLVQRKESAANAKCNNAYSSNQSSESGQTTGRATHSLSRDYREEEADTSPTWNYASGLPMQGGGSALDVGGNMYGSNNNPWD